MKKLFKKKSSLATTIIAIVAIVAIAFGGVGSTKAALTYFSDVYSGHVEMYDIGVSLLEKGQHDEAASIVSWRNYEAYSDGAWDEHTGELLNGMLDEKAGEKLVYGKTYPEQLSVKNTGTIDQYVRVNVYKYWEDADGNKDPEISPNLIQLHFIEGAGWTIDKGASTTERTVLYYNSLLPTGAQTSDFTDTLTVYVDENMVNKVTQTTADGTIKTTYDYNGYHFVIEAEVDAIQDHNAQDAALSAWGRNVTISGGSLTIN